MESWQGQEQELTDCLLSHLGPRTETGSGMWSSSNSIASGLALSFYILFYYEATNISWPTKVQVISFQ